MSFRFRGKTAWLYLAMLLFCAAAASAGGGSSTPAGGGRPAAANATAAPVPDQDARPMAKVNGASIPRWMFDNALRDKLLQAERQGRKPDPALRRTLAREVLDNLVQMELLAAEAKRRGVEADPRAGQVQAGIVAARAGSREKFEASLARAGMTLAQYQDIWRQQVSVNRLVEEVIQPGIAVDEADLLARFEQERGQWLTPGRVRVAELSVPLPRDVLPARRDQAMAELGRVREALAGSTDFLRDAAARAALLGADYPGAQVRDLGWRPSNEETPGVPNPVLREAAGYLSRPALRDGAVRLFAVLDAQPERPAAYEEARAQLLERLRSERTHAAIAELTARLRETDEVLILLDLP